MATCSSFTKSEFTATASITFLENRMSRGFMGSLPWNKVEGQQFVAE